MERKKRIRTSSRAITVIKASEGTLLTQAKDVAPEQRIFVETIYLAINDSPDNWREISVAEADAIRASIENE